MKRENFWSISKKNQFGITRQSGQSVTIHIFFFVLTDFFYLVEKRFSVVQENWEILLKLFFLY